MCERGLNVFAAVSSLLSDRLSTSAHVTYITVYLEEGKFDFARIERTLTCLLADSNQSTIIFALARLHAHEMIG